MVTVDRSVEELCAAGPIVLYDGHCGLCVRSVQFILRHDRRGRLRLAAQQTDVGRKLLQAHGAEGSSGESVVVLAEGRAWTGSDAGLRIARELGWPWRLLGIAGLLPRPIRDSVYGWIARHRYRWFGRRDVCMTCVAGRSERFLDGAEVSGRRTEQEPR